MNWILIIVIAVFHAHGSGGAAVRTEQIVFESETLCVKAMRQHQGDIKKEWGISSIYYLRSASCHQVRSIPDPPKEDE